VEKHGGSLWDSRYDSLWRVFGAGWRFTSKAKRANSSKSATSPFHPMLHGLQLEGAIATYGPSSADFHNRAAQRAQNVAIRRGNLKAPRGLRRFRGVENAVVRVLAVLWRYLGETHVHRTCLPNPSFDNEFHSIDESSGPPVLSAPYGLSQLWLHRECSADSGRLSVHCASAGNVEKTEAQYRNHSDHCLVQSHSPWRKVDRNPVCGWGQRRECPDAGSVSRLRTICQLAKFAWRGQVRRF